MNRKGTNRLAIECIMAAVEKDGDKFSSVILNVVKSYPFQNARNGAVVAKAEPQTGRPRLQPFSLQNVG